jgi:nucleotide-binding universal stress UspA family protein
MTTQFEGAKITEQSVTFDIVIVKPHVLHGVDGSDCGTRVLDFAAHEAALRGALLNIVCAYEDTPSTTPWPVVPPQLDQVSAAAIVDDSLSHAQAIEPAIVAKGEIRYGPAGRVLVEASRDAIM